MEILKYEIEDDIIAELLGVQNFTNKESAVLELVKNAYDAGASILNIFFYDDEIILKDNGIGMSYEVMKSRWTKVGSSDKDYEFIDKENKKRVYSGSKGIGRFALARLGKNVEVFSKMENEEGTRWFTNWKETKIEKTSINDVGTIIVIKKLRDNWTLKAVERFVQYMSATYNDDSMKINIFLSDKQFLIEKQFNAPSLGKNCLSIIKLEYNSELKILQCSIRQDEFLDEAKKYCKDIDLKEKTSSLNMIDEMFENLDVDKEELGHMLTDLGSFSAELYFSFKPMKEDCNRFLYKYQYLPEQYKEGIILYRNAFSISSYDGNKDWLELGKRSRKSPAAATHPTGSWRVRENQIAGKVIIDKKINSNLKDLSNRQGLDENEFYKLFVQILCKGITEFERYRQSIIRKINEKNKVINKPTKTIDTFVKAPLDVKEFEEETIHKLANEVNELKKQNEKQIKNLIITEQKYKYDTRILNTLSTVGLKAASIAHELHTNRDLISFSSEMLIPRLKELGVWEILDNEKNKIPTCDNVPLMLEENGLIIKKIINFMDIMLTNIEKKSFIPQKINIKDVLVEIKKTWEYDYNWITIDLSINDDIEFYSSIDIFNVIFDNLILNSIQQNDSEKLLKINICGIQNGNYLTFNYEDNGIGLNNKYIADPNRILEVHESSRENGHGLGMWIINNSLIMTGGEINNIDGHNGFHIQFTIGDNL